ncbi:MAG: hypothetical protein HZB46_09710 [Solirubrobacterales bacterium]|nr:hypothetical protein [Solirubrobacterales bacterium]
MSTLVQAPPRIAGRWHPQGAPPADGARTVGPISLTGGVAATDATGAVCVLSGRIPGEPLDSVAAAVAERLGRTHDPAAALEPLRGEFLAVLWDPATRTAALSRDQLGARGLHVHAAPGGGLVFGEEVADVLPLLASTPAPDRRTVALLLARGVFPRGHSVFEGLERIPPATMLVLRDGRRRDQTWWAPRWNGVEHGSEDELIARVVAGLDGAVARSADGERASVLLSGGMDSSAVAAGLVASGQTPTGYSGVFPAHPETDESDKIDDVVDLLGMRSVRREITGGSALGGSLDYVQRWRLPVISPTHYCWEPVFARAVADGFPIMLDGEGGDEVFDVSALLIADRLRHGRALSAWQLTRAITGVGPDASRERVRRLFVRHGINGAVPHLGHRLARRKRGAEATVPAWIRPEDALGVMNDYDQWGFKRDRGGPLWWREHVWLLTGIREVIDSHGFVRRRAWQVGLEGRHPFMHDLDLIEMVLRLPPEARFDHRFDRILLRKGLQGRLPDSVRWTQDKRRFNGLLEAALDGGDAAMFQEMLRPPDAEVRAFVRAEVLDELLAATPETYRPGPLRWRATMWRLGAVETWLRAQADSSFLQGLRDRLAADTEPVFTVRVPR